MKRQAEGVSCVPKEGVEQQPEKNGNKRIKLLKNEANQENLQVDATGEKSTMDSSPSSHKHKNNSTSEHMNIPGEAENFGHHPPQNTNENGTHLANGSYGNAVKIPADNDSGVVPENFYPNSREDAVVFAEENQEDPELLPPVLNHCDLDIQSSESTDSFTSEGFDGDSCTTESDNKIAVKPVTEEDIHDQEKEPSVESEVKENLVSPDNLMLSYLKVTELEGHTDVVYSVAADEDYILSSSADTTVKVWSAEHKSTVSTFSGHSDSVTSLILLTPNQSKILKKRMSLAKVSRIAITASLDCQIKLWSVVEGKELASMYTYNGITSLGYLESECIVVVGTEGGKLELWDISSREVKKSERAHEDSVTDIKVKDNYIYSTSVDGTVKVWIYEDDDIYPLYTRKRKEISSDKTGFAPAQWKTVDVFENVLYLGDNTNNIKVLDWKAGRLRLFKNHTENEAICPCVTVEKNMLFSVYNDMSSDTGGVNVWKLPEMTYVCTLTNVADPRSLAIVQKGNNLQIVCGGQKLSVWDFDFTKPPSSEDEYNLREIETLGLEIDEKPVEIKNSAATMSSPEKNNSGQKWCSLM